MNKIQYIKLLELRGVTTLLEGESIAMAVSRTGGKPLDKEMVQVNELLMKYYIGKFQEEEEKVEALNKEVQRLNGIIDKLEDDASFLRALEAAGVDNWEGYSIAQDIYEEE